MSADRKLLPSDLSSDQKQVFDAVMDWVSAGAPRQVGPFPSLEGFPSLGGKPPLLTIGGLGGSGKSSILGVLASQWKLQVAYVTFTGRAASVLERKLKACGVKTDSLPFRPEGSRGRMAAFFSSNPFASYCGTIHRLLYAPIVNAQDELLGFRKREQLDRAYDLIVIDEASMVSEEMLEDLQVHQTPILAVGDHGQLPPVQSSGSIVQDPDLKLEKIHRQAEKSPIIRLAHDVRGGASLRSWRGKAEGEISFLPQRSAEAVLGDALRDAASPLDVAAIAWTNRNRIRLNAMARKALGHRGPPKKGEVVLCLKNRPPVFNGMRGLLEEDSALGGEPRPWILRGKVDFPDEGLAPSLFEMFVPQFNREKTFQSLEEVKALGVEAYSMKEIGDLFDMGYALTCHKAQGSQFDHVVVYADKPEGSEDAAKWFYTAITRSSRLLTILM
jgi:exodeoxyribonuclease V